MIATLLRIAVITVRRDRVVQAMAFLLPIVFFSIFASVFGQQGRNTTSRVRVAVVDEDGSSASRRLVAALRREAGLRVRTEAPPPNAPPKTPGLPLDRARAVALVKDGTVPLALVVPHGYGEAFGRFDSTATAIELLADKSDPVAPQIVMGLLQKAAMTAAPDLMAKQGMGMMERYAGELTPRQRQAMDEWSRQLAAQDSASGGSPGGGVSGGMIATKVVDVLGHDNRNSLVAFYAAGIAVMFLLFSASSAGGSLLDEVETGTLERLLTSRVTMGTLLAGKWLYITLFGVFQITVMFVWGMIAFRLDLLPHLSGFFVMAVFTAAAAAAFGLVLATLCKSRQQLGGLATILILSQSALGGSMFPRFLMSETMQKMGLFTFNAWALDGFITVFWRDAAIGALLPQIGVLAGMTVVFLTIARLLARRWETV